MKKERQTDGGKGDAPRNLGAKFQTSYGDIKNFASNRVTQDTAGNWFYFDKRGKNWGPYNTRLLAVEAARVAMDQES